MKKLIPPWETMTTKNNFGIILRPRHTNVVWLDNRNMTDCRAQVIINDEPSKIYLITGQGDCRVNLPPLHPHTILTIKVIFQPIISRFVQHQTITPVTTLSLQVKYDDFTANQLY